MLGMSFTVQALDNFLLADSTNVKKFVSHKFSGMSKKNQFASLSQSLHWETFFGYKMSHVLNGVQISEVMRDATVISTACKMFYFCKHLIKLHHNIYIWNKRKSTYCILSTLITTAGSVKNLSLHRLSLCLDWPCVLVCFLKTKNRIGVMRYVVLHGRLWDDLYIGFQNRISRDPDIYHHKYTHFITYIKVSYA